MNTTNKEQTPATEELRSRILGLEMIDWKAMEFIQSDNFKVSTDEQYQKVVSSLVNNQFVAPFYVWQDKAGKHWCVDGKRRDTVLRRIEEEGGAEVYNVDTGQNQFYEISIPAELPALIIEADSQEEAAKLVLLYSSGYGEVTQQGLAEFIEQYDLNFPELKFDINLPEFSMPRFEQTFDAFGLGGNGSERGEAPYAEELEDFTPDEETEIVVQKDDVYELNGKHRLICGDSLLAETWQTLMNGVLARILITDPPYNIPYSLYGGLGKIQHEDFAMAVGEMGDQEFVEFLATYMRHAVSHTVDGSIHYNFMDFRHSWHMCEAGGKVYGSLMPKQICVWNKSIQANGSFYRAKHEFCFIFKSGEAKHLSHLELKDRFRSNVWEYKSANDFSNDERKEFGGLGALENHPTPKPVRMIADALLDTTDEGDIALDCFLGSGTTLMAAERTRRICYGVEYEPSYMQGILTRFINHCQTENKPFEIRRNGEVMTGEALVPLMPK